jgi:hypothetical protein
MVLEGLIYGQRHLEENMKKTCHCFEDPLKRLSGEMDRATLKVDVLLHVAIARGPSATNHEIGFKAGYAGKKFFFLFYVFGIFIIFSSVALHRGQPSAKSHPRWQPTRKLAVCCGGAGFEPDTAGQQSDVLPLSHHAFPICGKITCNNLPGFVWYPVCTPYTGTTLYAS